MERREDTIIDEDLRAALREMKSYVDITEEDLKKIYAVALKHARQRAMSGAPVRDVMTKNVVMVLKQDPVGKATQLLSEHRISGLPVVDRENRVVGVVSEADVLAMTGMRRGHTFKDVVRHVLGEPLPGRKTGDTVGDIMTAPAVTIRPDAEIGEAARVIDERKIKRLPVVDDENRLVGIISRADIVRAMGKK